MVYLNDNKTRENIYFIPDVDIEKCISEDQDKPLVLLERIDIILKIHSFIIKNNKDKEKNLNYQEILDKHLAACSDLLGITTLQTLLLTFILNSGSLSLGGLANLLKVTKVQCFKYLDDLEVLLDKRFIKKSDSGEEELDSDYWIPYEVIQSLREGKAFTPPRHCNLSKDQFFEYSDKFLSELFGYNNFNNGIIPINWKSPNNFPVHGKTSKKILIMDFNNLLEDNPQLEFVQKIKSLSLNEDNLFFLSYLCTKFYFEENNVFDSRDINFHDNKDIDYQQLFKLELIEYYGDDFKDKNLIVLTNKAIIELLGITEALHKPRSEFESDLIKHENITHKELIYNTKERKLVNQLTELLSENNYKNVTERLKAKGMRTGFNCLFFGVPGTGKTETVYQIARIVGRDIMSIDISATKSHWFGESEKIMRNIFTQYRHKVEKTKHKNLPSPILLLNEADAIINKRKDTSTSTVAQTENTIQNIILEEMEKLNGIMIATTNLTENFDTAFERRFIYKIEFQKPDIEIRRLIWKSLIPELTEKENIKLADVYNFSGGQIENISRRRTIVGLLSGKDPDLDELVSFCNEESILKKDTKIGF